MKLLFLDVDGVLNDNHLPQHSLCGEIFSERVHNLNSIIRETGAKIVLSSAWRYLVYRGEMNLTGLNWLFRSHGLIKDAIIGITGPDAHREHYDGTGEWKPTSERGKQISEFLKTVSYSKYAVVDDRNDGITEEGHWLYLCAAGLDLKAAGTIVDYLNA